MNEFLNEFSFKYVLLDHRAGHFLLRATLLILLLEDVFSDKWAVPETWAGQRRIECPD